MSFFIFISKNVVQKYYNIDYKEKNRTFFSFPERLPSGFYFDVCQPE